MIGTVEARRSELDELYPCWIPRTLWTQLLFTSVHHGDNEFIIFEDSAYTYSETVENSVQYARSLVALGIMPGDHVAIHMDNCPEYIFLTFALSMIGAVKVPINPKCGLTEFCHCLEASDARFLISNCGKFPVPVVSPPLTAVVYDGPSTDAADHEVIYSWEEFRGLSSSVDVDIVECVSASCQNPDGMSDIIFTSGSCARPKGVIETHDQLLRNAYGTARTRCYEFGHRAYLPTPLCHVMAYVTGLLPLLMVGGTAIFSSHGNDVRRDIDLLRKHRANDIICMPSQIMKILGESDIKPGDFPHLHSGMWTACAPWVWDTAREKLGIRDLTHAYGMTECGANLTMTSPDDPPDKVKLCNGRLLDAGVSGVPEYGGMQMEMRVCSFETGEVLPHGQKGEIQYRGVSTTPGYYENEAANRESFTADGWFKSRDFGFIDSDGYLHFIQRNSEMYKMNGENVSPRFVESVLSECALVNDLACVGIPHKKHGSIGVAFIDADDESADTMDQIQDFCKIHLASYQVPAYFCYSKKQNWPLTSSGKIHRAELAALARKLFDDGALIPRK